MNGSELVRGVTSRLPEHVVVTGGLAGDGDRFGRTWVLSNGKADTNCVVAVGLYGNRLRIGHRSKSGSGPSEPALSIAISCVGRRLVLCGERTEEENEATLEKLPGGTQQVGFCSYGEISPHTTGRCDLHNQTMTLNVLSEAM